MCDLASHCRLWARINFAAKLTEYSVERLAEIHSLLHILKLHCKLFLNLSISVVCYSSDSHILLLANFDWQLPCCPDLFHNLCPCLASVFVAFSHTSQTCFFFGNLCQFIIVFCTLGIERRIYRIFVIRVFLFNMYTFNMNLF